MIPCRKDRFPDTLQKNRSDTLLIRLERFQNAVRKESSDTLLIRLEVPGHRKKRELRCLADKFRGQPCSRAS
jgi:hypothetical protein